MACHHAPVRIQSESCQHPCHDMSSSHDMSSCYNVSSRRAMASCHDMSTSHAMSESQKMSRLNLDVLTVPEALVNTIRILEMFSTRLNPPEPIILPEKITSGFTSGTFIIESAMLPGVPWTPPELLGWPKRRYSKKGNFQGKNSDLGPS